MTIKPGAFRFNNDSMKLEIFRGSANYEGSASMAGIGTLAAGQWEEIQATSPEVQTGGTRGVFGGGDPGPSTSNRIDYINIASTGNAIDFGNLTAVRAGAGACSSSTRGVFGGGATPTRLNIIEFITIASTGDAVDFGDLTEVRRELPACSSSSTRGVIGGGEDASAKVIHNRLYHHMHQQEML